MFKEWTRFEKIWLFVFAGLILATTVVTNLMFGTDWGSTQMVLLNWVIGPISSLTGIICVVLVAKGKISNYTWGLVNCITYGYIAYKVGYYGDMMLNWFFFVPFQFIGWYAWKKRLIAGSKTDVKMKKLTPSQWMSMLVGGIVVVFAFGLLLNGVDGWFTTAMKRNESIYTYLNNITGVSLFGPIFDSSTEVFQILAQLLMTFAYAEQWPLWMANNVITILMWIIVAIAAPAMLPMALVTVVMWFAYLVNSTYGWYNWNKGAKLQSNNI
jgi:nicotinamide mononucleotide transporter